MINILKELLQVSVLFTTLSVPSSTSTLNIQTIASTETQGSVIYNAGITQDNVNKLKRLYEEEPFEHLELTSDGGEFDAGMDLAVFLYQNHISVNVPTFCASACTFAFFSTRKNMRTMGEDAIIAIHNVSFNSNIEGSKKLYISVDDMTKFAEEAATKAAMMYSLYASVGIPSTVMLQSAKLRNNKAIAISKQNLVDWGVINP